SLLESVFRVTRLDLPGHGRSRWDGPARLDDWTDAALATVPRPAVWLGWSLGGLVASRAALRAPAQVTALVIVACTPCFVRKPGWQSAMLPDLLDTFAADLEQDYSRTLHRFLALQVRGSEHAGGVLRTLRKRLLAHGEPATAALRAGLEILRETDLRTSVAAIRCPVLLLAGERDTLVPVAAARAAAALYPAARLRVIEGAGHAPFIARPRQVAAIVQEFRVPAGSGQPGGHHG
ncbi:MAG: pimeloyl-ACP methyl ester esterase BioH, partial [Gammaproteobacteria bacterium]